MSIYEYNQEEHMRMEREQNYANGLTEGRAMEIVRLCREFGMMEDDIMQRLKRELEMTEEEALAYMKA